MNASLKQNLTLPPKKIKKVTDSASILDLKILDVQIFVGCVQPSQVTKKRLAVQAVTVWEFFRRKAQDVFWDESDRIVNSSMAFSLKDT